MPISYPILRTAVAGSLCALLLATPGIARAQGKFEANYAISIARIPIGSVTASADFSDAQYGISMSGRASGVMRVLASGDGTLSTPAASSTPASRRRPSSSPAPPPTTTRST